MFRHILVVCLGNICRSPVGARILQQKLPHSTVRSAGLNAVVGHGIDRDFGLVASGYGIDVDRHYARQLTQAMCYEQDLILVMESRHISILAAIAPQAQGKTLLFGHWQNHLEIRDPFRRSREEHQHSIQQLLASATGWAGALSN
jgi:protein-tyrosine phosphatase